MRLKTMEYLATSTITLTSLAQLLGKISNMVINDHIQQQVEQGLEAIHQVWEQFICDLFSCSTCGILRCGVIAKLERGALGRVVKGGAIRQSLFTFLTRPNSPRPLYCLLYCRLWIISCRGGLKDFTANRRCPALPYSHRFLVLGFSQSADEVTLITFILVLYLYWNVHRHSGLTRI